ncbi:type IV pilin [Halosimplex halophilum]|uniref:type IV pilin n=1 Tax=Halosimplex halophilum TaxID=2559572 RepID=UPI0014354F3F|nr:type IV pilin [Halosimplex halophilum]
MTDDPPASPPREPLRSDRAATPVVGVVLLVGVTVLLAAVAAAAVGFEGARPEPAPQASLDAELSATDGWPDGQRLRLVHEGGDTLAVADLAVVVAFERTGDRARLSGFPTRRLTDEHVRGADLFDRTYAGVDGALDAAHTDGQWAAGETASVRIAQNELDVRPGDRAAVRVIHRPTGAQLTRTEVGAS